MILESPERDMNYSNKLEKPIQTKCRAKRLEKPKKVGSVVRTVWISCAFRVRIFLHDSVLETISQSTRAKNPGYPVDIDA
jgi:hypothetical protein